MDKHGSKPSTIIDDPLYTPADTARKLKMGTSWLAKLRMRGDGPRYIKLGRAVRYPESAIREYLLSRTRTSTSQD
jgi:predicted DNA-binding transcriptional regulator AlpA